MNFDLSQHPNAQTDLSMAKARAMAGRGASSARRGGAAAGAAAFKLSGSAAAAARRAGSTSYETVQAFKKRWGAWLNSRSSQVNLWFLISNVLYIALGITALTLTQIVVHEHVDDFKRNEFTQHKSVDGSVKQYPPCGMPTPDSMYLLQAIGALPAAGWDGASLEPNYKKWMQTVDRALCARIMPGVDVPEYFEDLSDCADTGKVGTYTTGANDHVEELLTLGYLLEEPSLTPTGADYQDATLMNAKHALFEKRVCLEDDDPDTGEEPLYSKQQRDAYGELKTRVARAYVAAMPAFARYQNERQTCAVPEAFKDPFDHMCKHSCHIRLELHSAANDQRVMWDSATALPETSFTKQLYRLLALSLAGYYDRYHNNGECFRNSEVDVNGDALGPIEFCKNSMKMGISTTEGTGVEGVTAYTNQDENFARLKQCGATYGTYPPPSPAPPVYRHNDDDTEKLAVHACAATLQYGLFEQGRLFGIPDVIQPFVLDNRVDRSLHFLGEFIYDHMYVKPMEKAADILADPKSKLELYIAYRLSATSIWAILVANVAGFMLVRAALPMGIWILKVVGVRSTNIESQSAGGTVFKEIQLVRPLIGGPIYLVLAVNALIIYWIFWLDPATQSHYYTAPTCEDWRGLGVQVPSGAFGTSWGKRRYARFGEHVIGILLLLLFMLVIVQRIIGQGFVDEELKKANAAVTLGETARLDWVAYAMIAFALCIQVLYISQSIVSGDDWYQAIKASDNDAKMLDVFSRDVLMSVWAAFWTATAIAWFRQKWAVQELPRMYQYAWMASCLLTLWMPVFQSAVLLEKEIDAAFSDGKGTSDTPRLIIYIMIYAFSAIWTAILAIRLRAVWKAMPNESASSKSNTSASVRNAKEQGQAIIAVAEAEHAAQQESESIDQRLRRMAMQRQAVGKFDLSGLNLGPQGVPVRPGRKTDTVYMPLLPSH